ncbi:hypothetical protein J7L18_09565 [Candidatus Bathyarchaeota archaeon]|nr:hypothetical protein [Candidatus Bathyarchaeota archaeon]
MRTWTRSRSVRVKPFLDESFVDVRQFDRELIELLWSGRTLSDEEILSSLNMILRMWILLRLWANSLRALVMG